MKNLASIPSGLLTFRDCSKRKFGLLAGAFLVLISGRTHATPPGHHISAANITVIQNLGPNTPAPDNNNTNTVTTFTSLSINDFRVRGAGAAGDDMAPLNSRGDFSVQIGATAASNLYSGILMSSITQNGRDNGEGVTNIYCVPMIEAQRPRTNIADPTTLIGAYWIPVNNTALTGGGAGSADEYDINVAGAFFPYTEFYGGFARNSGDANGMNPTNGGAMNELIGTPGLVLGQNFIDLGAGKSFVTLTNFGIDSRSSGILLVVGAKNESANYGLSQVNNANGGWNLFIKDDGQGTLTSFEQDPIAFVFIPKTNTTVVSGRFNGNASISSFSGASAQFTVTSNAAGVYELKIPSKTPTNGVLIISAEGGTTVNQDNFVSYQLNPANDGWIIQSRDCPGGGLEAIPTAEAVVSFVFIPGPTPGFAVNPTNNLFTSEDGDTASFTVALDRQPNADVTIPVSSSNTGEGTVSVSSLTFTTNNWNVPQTVTITGVNDAVIDGAVGYTIVLGAATSTDLNYNGLDPADVSVVNLDNDNAITVSPTSGLITTEAGGTATFDVHLNSAPSANVTIALSSSNTGEGTVSPSSLTFTPGNFSVDQTVTVTGVNDFVDDGNVAYTIITAPAVSADSFFNGQNAADVSVVNTDDDTAGYVVSAAGPAGLSVVEGRTSTYTVVLQSRPTASVTVTPVSSNTSQGGTVAPATLTFTTVNWSNAQTVTVTGADDLVVDGNTSWTITNSISSADPIYAALAATPVLMTTLDNEAAITLPSGALIYGIGQPGVGLDGRGTISDSNTLSFNGTTLIVTITSNAAAGDVLAVRNDGTGSGQIGTSGASVTYEGITIAGFTNGTAAIGLTFNSSATAAAVQAAFRNITYRNSSTNPPINTRIATVRLTHADTGTAIATVPIRVSLLHYVDYQQNLDHGYGMATNETDISLREADPNTPYPVGASGGLFTDPSDPLAHNSWQILMRFDDLFGNGNGQIPTNAIIVAADLTLTVPPADPNGSGDGSPLFRMLVPWDGSNATWSTFGSGVSQDDAVSRSVADSQWGLADGSGSTTSGGCTISVLPDINAWLGGQSNYGWVLPGWPTNFDGTTVSPGEAAIENERPRLRILWVPAGTAVATFRQNVNGYTNAADTSVRPSTPTTSSTATATIGVDDQVGTTVFPDPSYVLMKFDNIIGSNPGQITPGSQIAAAMLNLAALGGSAQGHGGSFHAMLRSWVDTDTWSSLGGIAPDNISAASAITASAGSPTLTPFLQGGYLEYELTPDVQSWANGTLANNGWAIFTWPGGADGWFFSSDNNATASTRPQLRVYYTAAPPVPHIVTITPGAGTMALTFTGPASSQITIYRSATVTGTYSSIGTTTTSAGGTGSFTDPSPLATAAFYRISSP